MREETNVVQRVREFNRFYTAALGMLNRKFLDSDYSVTESRILFELNRRDSCSASLLTEMLHIDKSYLSRILKAFEQKGLLTRSLSPKDGRAFLIRLTDKGKKETSGLIERANGQIERLTAPLTPEECAELCKAMDAITEFLTRKDTSNENHQL